MRVVPLFDKIEDGHPGLGSRSEPMALYQFALEGCKEALAEGIVVATRAWNAPNKLIQVVC